MDDVDASLRDSFRFSVNLSRYLEGYFEESNYGEGVKELYIGILCKSVLTGMPLEEILDSDKYYKKRKQVECDIYLEYQTAASVSQIELQAMVVNEILNSLDTTFHKLKVKDFELQTFKDDLRKACDLVAPGFAAVFGHLSGITGEEKKQIFRKYIQEHKGQALDKNIVPHAGGAAEKAEKEKTAAKEELQMQPTNMNAAAFWRLIEKTKQESDGEQEEHEKLLIEALSRLSYPDIGTFHAIYNFYHQLADRPKLITAAAIICDGLTDDDFEYFRPWLIGEGERVYKKALANPDSLADVVKTDEFADFELLAAVAIEATKRKHERDKVEYWLTYGQPEEYELDEKQIAECQTGIVFDPELDNKVFGWSMYDRDEARFQTMRTKAFPRLIAKCEKE
jgi:hypothetical protein